MRQDIESMGREEAQLRLAANREVRQSVMSISSDISKWLYASLLTVNSGGLLALVGSEKFGVAGADFWASGSYLLGIFLSFLLGYLTLLRGSGLLISLDQESETLINQLIGNIPEKENVEEKRSAFDRFIRGDRLPHIVGWASAALFLVGSAVRVVGLT